MDSKLNITNKKKYSTKIKVLLVVVVIILSGFLLPQKIVIPVKNAAVSDWHTKTFWYEPWGKSGVHKGIDIFAKAGTPVIAATYGVVVYKAKIKRGGNVVAILGPKWRIHYYAHLAEINVHTGDYVSTAEKIGTVGDSGNAKGKPPHLHYAILTIIPYLWRWDGATQGWKKIIYLNPDLQLK